MFIEFYLVSTTYREYRQNYKAIQSWLAEANDARGDGGSRWPQYALISYNRVRQLEISGQKLLDRALGEDRYFLGFGLWPWKVVLQPSSDTRMYSGLYDVAATFKRRASWIYADYSELRELRREADAAPLPFLPQLWEAGVRCDRGELSHWHELILRQRDRFCQVVGRTIKQHGQLMRSGLNNGGPYD